jgi:hypothetical protein
VAMEDNAVNAITRMIPTQPSFFRMEILLSSELKKLF